MKNKSLADYINNAPKPKIRFAHILIAPAKEIKDDVKKKESKNKKVAKKKKKAIKKAPPEQPMLCKDSLSDISAILGELTEKVGNINQEYNNDDLSAICNGIVETMNMYHMTVIEEMAKIDVNPVVDMSKLDAINDRLLTVIQTLAMRKPKEWDFEIERDMMGEMTNVKATEVTH